MVGRHDGYLTQQLEDASRRTGILPPPLLEERAAQIRDGVRRPELLDLPPPRVQIVRVEVLLHRLVQRRVGPRVHQPIDPPDEVLHGEGRRLVGAAGRCDGGLLELQERDEGGGSDAAVPPGGGCEGVLALGPGDALLQEVVEVGADPLDPSGGLGGAEGAQVEAVSRDDNGGDGRGLAARRKSEPIGFLIR